MSNEGRLGRGDAAALAGVLDPNWLFRHRHAPAEFLGQYRDLAETAAAEKPPGLRALAPNLPELIADEKTLYAALKHLHAEGSHAPGPDGLRYEDVALIGDWPFCHSLRDAIRSGEYEPGEERVRKIPKGPGRGHRELVVQSVADRVVHRAAVEILQPLLDPLFDPGSFGYRPGKGPLRALATAERLDRGGRGVWVSADIRNAFPSVPVQRLLKVVEKYLPDDALLALLETLTRPDKTPGLRQGSPLSPLVLNLYLHHVLDRPWRRRYPDAPLLRFADDTLVSCENEGQAADAYDDLAELLRPAGFTLRESQGDAIHPLSDGRESSWMDFGVSAGPGGLRFTVTDEAWGRLGEAFEEAHGKPNSPLAAAASLAAWVGAKAPCHPQVEMKLAYRRITDRGGPWPALDSAWSFA